MEQRLVTIRNQKRKRKPQFLKQSAMLKNRVGMKWRKPRGSDSKIKVNRKGYHRRVNIGFRGPALARGLSRDGKRIRVVYALTDLHDIDTKNDVVCIGSVGKRNKIQIIEACTKQGFALSNVKDPAGYITSVQDDLHQKKQAKAQKKAAAQESEKSKKAEKKSIDSAVSDEEKKAQEKKEKDKELTKREL